MTRSGRMSNSCRSAWACGKGSPCSAARRCHAARCTARVSTMTSSKLKMQACASSGRSACRCRMAPLDFSRSFSVSTSRCVAPPDTGNAMKPCMQEQGDGVDS